MRAMCGLDRLCVDEMSSAPADRKRALGCALKIARASGELRPVGLDCVSDQIARLLENALLREQLLARRLGADRARHLIVASMTCLRRRPAAQPALSRARSR